MKLTPPTRMAGLVRDPRRSVIDDLLDARHRERLVAEQPLARRIVADDEHVGLAAVEQRQRDAGESRMEQRALPFDHVPMIVAARPG